jgi:hypothetical protein
VKTFLRSNIQPRSGVSATWCLALLFAMPSTALAYVDPGAAGILIQSVIAAIAFVGAFWRRLRNAFFRRDPDKGTTRSLGPAQASDAD